MLPKEYRLPKSQIPILFQSGKRIGNSSLLVIFQQTSNASSRFCIILKKKKGLGAAERNRTKRLIRESLRKRQTHISNPVDAILMVSPFDDTISQRVVDETVGMLFSKITNI